MQRCVCYVYNNCVYVLVYIMIVCVYKPTIERLQLGIELCGNKADNEDSNLTVSKK